MIAFIRRGSVPFRCLAASCAGRRGCEKTRILNSSWGLIWNQSRYWSQMYCSPRSSEPSQSPSLTWTQLGIPIRICLNFSFCIRAELWRASASFASSFWLCGVCLEDCLLPPMLIYDTSVVLAWLVKVSLVLPPHHVTQCNNSYLYACELSAFSFRWCQSWWTPSFLKTAETSGLCQDRCLGSYFSMRKWVFKKFCQTHSSCAKIAEIITSQRSKLPPLFPWDLAPLCSR